LGRTGGGGGRPTQARAPSREHLKATCLKGALSMGYNLAEAKTSQFGGKTGLRVGLEGEGKADNRLEGSPDRGVERGGH